ncbi:MAG: TIGR03936 family radical SAM-associated protein [Propionibacteriales bacterium]|nr:TIGR03936 family radical SAM-associated protein [Propionibacteriales bacterium]
MSARKQPPQQPPPVQRLRVRYAKRGRARFASHRDFGRAFERALRRAGVPMAFSSGFHPHPRISYVNAAPTGAASEAEYLEIGLAEVRDPAQVRDDLNAAMPDGLAIVEVAEAAAGSLPELLAASTWQVEWTVDRAGLKVAIAALLAADEVLVQRQAKSGLRSFDVRGAVLALHDDEAGFVVTVRTTEPLVRPDDVVAALRQLAPELPQTPALFTRLAQGPWDGAAVTDPLAPGAPSTPVAP